MNSCYISTKQANPISTFIFLIVYVDFFTPKTCMFNSLIVFLEYNLRPVLFRDQRHRPTGIDFFIRAFYGITIKITWITYWRNRLSSVQDISLLGTRENIELFTSSVTSMRICIRLLLSRRVLRLNIIDYLIISMGINHILFQTIIIQLLLVA